MLAFCALTVAAPVLFFSVVPANGDSALFFDRYMIPATPAFLTLVVAGCLGAARWAGAWRLLALAILVAGLVAIELRFDANRRDGQRDIRLDAVTEAVRHEPAGTVLFGSTGTSGVAFSSFDYGHPANLLDRYLALRVPSLDTSTTTPASVRSASCAAARRSAGSGSSMRRRRPSRLRRVGPSRLPGATAQEVAGGYFVVRSRQALAAAGLVALGRSLRLAGGPPCR